MKVLQTSCWGLAAVPLPPTSKKACKTTINPQVTTHKASLDSQVLIPQAPAPLWRSGSMKQDVSRTRACCCSAGPMAAEQATETILLNPRLAPALIFPFPVFLAIFFKMPIFFCCLSSFACGWRASKKHSSVPAKEFTFLL